METDLLKPSTPDTIALSDAIESRFKSLCHAYARLRGMELGIPKKLDSDFLRWRTMAVRHKKGDFRNTISERQSIQTIAQWLVDTNAAIRNQPAKVIEWSS